MNSKNTQMLLLGFALGYVAPKVIGMAMSKAGK